MTAGTGAFVGSERFGVPHAHAKPPFDPASVPAPEPPKSVPFRPATPLGATPEPPVVNEPELPAFAPIAAPRPVVRAILVAGLGDASKRPSLLLVKKLDTTTETVRWIFPGGGIGDLDPSETLYEALEREVAEEVGHRLDDTSPRVPAQRVVERFQWEGVEHCSDVTYVAVPVHQFVPVLERKPSSIGAGWWTMHELEQALEHSPGLFAVTPELLAKVRKIIG